MKGCKTPDKAVVEGFDNLIRFDDELLTIFAGNMGSDRYKEAEKIIACAALPKSKALLRALFTNHGIIGIKEAKNHFFGNDRLALFEDLLTKE